jgi:hypothetical protein
MYRSTTYEKTRIYAYGYWVEMAEQRAIWSVVYHSTGCVQVFCLEIALPSYLNGTVNSYGRYETCIPEFYSENTN